MESRAASLLQAAPWSLRAGWEAQVVPEVARERQPAEVWVALALPVPVGQTA